MKLEKLKIVDLKKSLPINAYNYLLIGVQAVAKSKLTTQKLSKKKGIYRQLPTTKVRWLALPDFVSGHAKGRRAIRSLTGTLSG